jgi:hypothetical protein
MAGYIKEGNMRKNMLRIFFFSLAFVVGMLIITGTAMTFCDYCDPVDRVTNQGWTVTLLYIDEKDNGLYSWHYKIENDKKTSSGLNYAAMLIPDCCTDPTILVDLYSSTLFKQVFEVGLGRAY